jgi:hypothetical protein
MTVTKLSFAKMSRCPKGAAIHPDCGQKALLNAFGLSMCFKGGKP